MDKETKINKIKEMLLSRTNIKESSRNINRIIRDYNNYSMKISSRVNLIHDNYIEFEKFYLYYCELRQIQVVKTKESLIKAVVNFFRNR